MALVFFLTFSVIGSGLSDLLDAGITALGSWVDAHMTAWNVNDVIHSLVMDGIFNGVGSVLSFLPIIVTLFFFLSLLEDSGYMARVAFVMDKLLRKIGLSGRSIVPMLVGFGCTVPGVMASRTLPSDRDRKMTILLTPFMSCSAKLPIYAFFTAAFFPKHGALVMIALYFGGIVIGILMALFMRGTLFQGEAVPFVMELPNYRMPGAKNVGHLLWDKAKDFLQRAFTVIFMATLVIWFLQTFDLHLNIVADSKDSILALAAGKPCIFVCTHGLWRLADLHGADHRIYGKGKRGFDAFRVVWFHRGAADGSDAAFCCEPSGVLPAVYALCGGDCFDSVGSLAENGRYLSWSDSA